MFIDSRPVTGYGETAGWKMPFDAQEPTPRAPQRRPPMLAAQSSASSLAGMEQTIPPTLKRPPLTTASSSKSSLVGMEQAIMPFADFTRQTPPIEESKPLPPTPLRRRGSSYGGNPSASSREASPSGPPRRSSSIYSRTVSQWLPESPVWTASDLEDNPVPALPHELLRPIAYSASTPQLVEKEPAAPLLQPRTYQPLLTTPSPTISRRTTPSPNPAPVREGTRSSTLLPTTEEKAQIPKTHLRTVSLEKANAASKAPGAQHLLPEELRAKSKGTAARRSRSLEPIVREPIVRDTLAMFGRSIDSPPMPPEVPAMTLVDPEGRDRVVGSPRLSVAPLPGFAFPQQTMQSFSPTINSFPVGEHPPRTMVPLKTQGGRDFEYEIPYRPSYGFEDEERGRTFQRGPRYSNQQYNQFDDRSRNASSSEREDDGAQQMAHDYNSLLADRFRQGSPSTLSSTVETDADIGQHMRMIPQPLFHSKPMQTGKMSGRYDSGTGSISPFHRREQSGGSFSSQSRSPGHRYLPSLPPRLSLPKKLRRRSSMGTIPISPPLQYSQTYTTPMPSIPQPRIIPRHRRNSNDNRVSAYWHIPTAGGTELLFRRSNEKSPSLPAPKPPGVPLLAADIIAQRLLTPEVTPEPTPLAHPAASTTTTTTTPKLPKELTAKQALLARITKGAAKYAEQLTRPAGHDPRLPPERPPPAPTQQRSYEPLTLQAIQEMLSPPPPPPPPPQQRTPSPPKRPTHASRPSLGWSSAAKHAFDSSNGHHRPQQQQQRKPSVAAYTHVVAPARPLDERGTGAAAEEERPGARRGSLFSGLRELRREVKAERRREDIKRSIRLVGVPGAEEGGGVGSRGRSAEGQRERGEGERPPAVSGWGRRMSWIGGGMV